MSERDRDRVIFICSDSVGETAEAVVLAVLHQFGSAHAAAIKRYAHVKTEEEMRTIAEAASRQGAFIAYTIVLPELREALRLETERLGVIAVDIMGPLMQAYIDTFKGSPARRAGLLHQLDEDYYRRVDAVEFAVKGDDGKDMNAIGLSDIVLIGVSRTSKTPLSIFLAHKGIKVSNYPLVPEIMPPSALLRANAERLVGLTMDAVQMTRVRSERLKALGLPPDANYASLDRVKAELAYASAIFRDMGCLVIDVTGKAIEETAGMIMERYPRG